MIRKSCIRGMTARLAAGLAAFAMLLACSQAASPPREPNAKFVPELKKDQTVVYEIHGRVQRHVKTQSRVASILQPRDEKQEFSGQLHVKIKEVRVENGRPVVSARADFHYPDGEAGNSSAAEKRVVEFTIGGNGQVRNVAGFDDLEPIERMAWQFWISRFAFGWTLPPENPKRGKKWKDEEPESNPAPIARLLWERETTYGENIKCPVVAAQTCAVFFTSARLKQKSPAKDTTPEDYRLHELKTAGTATGTNEIFTTISQQTGLTVRGSEDVRQSMSVVIVKADESNGVKYTIDAASHFELVLAAANASPAR